MFPFFLPSFLPPHPHFPSIHLSFHLTITSYWCKISILRKIIRELSLLSDIIGTFADLLYNDNVPKVSLHIHTNCFLLSIYRKILACPKPLHTENLGGSNWKFLWLKKTCHSPTAFWSWLGAILLGGWGLDSKIPVPVFKAKATDVEIQWVLLEGSGDIGKNISLLSKF